MTKTEKRRLLHDLQTAQAKSRELEQGMLAEEFTDNMTAADFHRTLRLIRKLIGKRYVRETLIILLQSADRDESIRQMFKEVMEAD